MWKLADLNLLKYTQPNISNMSMMQRAADTTVLAAPKDWKFLNRRFRCTRRLKIKLSNDRKECPNLTYEHKTMLPPHPSNNVQCKG